MNLLETMNDEISSKKLTKDEKIRYIYLKLCRLFSFDTRWNYACVIEDYKTHLNIRNKVFDIRNIDEFKAICHTFVPYILKPLIEEFTNVDVDIVERPGHTYAMTTFNNEKYILDPTGGYDLCNVKMHVYPTAFKPKDIRYDYNELFRTMDEYLGFIHMTMDEFINLYDLEEKNLCLRKEKISKLLDNSSCRYTFSDASHFVSAIDNYNGINEFYEHTKVYIGENYDFHKFYYLCKEDACYELYNKNDEYKLREISKNKCLKLTKNLKACQIKSLF